MTHSGRAQSDGLTRARKLHDRGTKIPGQVSAESLRRRQREVLASTEFAGHRWEVLRHGKIVAAVIPVAELRALEAYERAQAETYREYCRALAENARLRAQLGADWDPGPYGG